MAQLYGFVCRRSFATSRLRDPRRLPLLPGYVDRVVDNAGEDVRSVDRLLILACVVAGATAAGRQPGERAVNV
jgi:hypothetical protein